jgi:hypothetical protein
MSDTNLKLSDEAIGQVAKLIQLAILTGTDIVDNLRTLRLVTDGESLYLSTGYKEAFNANLDKLAEEVQEKSSNLEDTTDTDFDQASTTKIFS